MAKMLPILGEIKGSIGAVTFRKSMNGPMAMVCKPICRVEGQAGVPGKIDRNRALVAFLSRMWSTLDNTQRQAWRDWAAVNPQPDGFGGTFLMSGINAFVQLNHTRMRIWPAETFNELPPIAQPPAQVDTVNIGTGVGASAIDAAWTIAGTEVEDDAIEVAISQPYCSAGKHACIPFKYNKQTAGNILLTSITGLCPTMWYWVRVRYVVVDGQVTTWMTGQALSSAAA